MMLIHKGYCDVCASPASLLYDLNEIQQVLTQKVYEVLKLQVKIFPKSACADCAYRLVSFDQFVQRIIAANQIMHGNEESAQKHEYNCECRHCEDKFGGLPLLIQVIEGQAEEDKQQLAKSEPEPSTSSHGQSPTRKGPKEMKCEDCGKIFTHRGDMNKHLRTHSGEQPFSCQICDKKFAHTSNLSRHLKVHSGDKPYECSVCGKNFSRKDKLQLHQKTKLCKRRSLEMQEN